MTGYGTAWRCSRIACRCRTTVVPSPLAVRRRSCPRSSLSLSVGRAPFCAAGDRRSRHAVPRALGLGRLGDVRRRRALCGHRHRHRPRARRRGALRRERRHGQGRRARSIGPSSPQRMGWRQLWCGAAAHGVGEVGHKLRVGGSASVWILSALVAVVPPTPKTWRRDSKTRNLVCWSVVASESDGCRWRRRSAQVGGGRRRPRDAGGGRRGPDFVGTFQRPAEAGGGWQMPAGTWGRPAEVGERRRRPTDAGGGRRRRRPAEGAESGPIGQVVPDNPMFGSASTEIGRTFPRTGQIWVDVDQVRAQFASCPGLGQCEANSSEFGSMLTISVRSSHPARNLGPPGAAERQPRNAYSPTVGTLEALIRLCLFAPPPDAARKHTRCRRGHVALCALGRE